MVKLSGFADEISPDLQTQLDTLDQLGIRFLELRGVWGKNVLDLSQQELQQVKSELDRRGIGVSAIGSPIGKVKLEDVDDGVRPGRRIVQSVQHAGVQNHLEVDL